MQNTSALYDDIVSSENYWFEVALAIGESGRLIDEFGNVLIFGDTAILVDSGGAETAFREYILMSMSTKHSVFNENYPVVGSAISGEIDITMIKPVAAIPKMARLAPYVRATDGERYSEWLPKGIYYIDTRETSHNSNGLDIVTIHGYDAMLMFEQNYPSDNQHSYPLLDRTMVQFLADSINISVDPRTFIRMDKNYQFSLPVGYSSREVLGMIAASYGGNFVISDEGQLLLIRLCDLPKETNYLVTESGDVLVFGSGKEIHTLSGSVVSFDGDGTDLIDLSVGIDPVQSGTGDPSPTNVRPISGWTGCNVIATGKNLFDASTSTAKKYITTTGTIESSDDWSASSYISVKAGLTYTLSGVTEATGYVACHAFYDGDKQFISSILARGHNTFTVPDNAYFARLSLKSESPTTAQLELGSTATDFVAYAGQNIPITFPTPPGTVYGGYVDPLRGKLVVTHGLYTYNGTEDWDTTGTGNAYYVRISGCKRKPATNYLKGLSPGSSSGLHSWECRLNANQDTFMITPDLSVYDTAEKWKTFLSTNNLQVFLELVTSIEYDLTPITLSTLYGENNIWADTGDILSLTYSYGGEPTKILV